MNDEAGVVQAAPPPTRATRRVALGVSYVGSAYKGWQSQPG
jgi:tRNA pseudouridine38-40 synthase